MKSLIKSCICCLLFSASSTALAQTFTVKKVKGKQAIVNMNSGSFYEGQTVTVGGESSSGAVYGGSLGGRNNYLGLQGGLTNSKVGTSTLTTLAVDLLYGWNKVKYEYGILGGFSSVSGGASNSSSFEIGGKFDFNFNEHHSGTPNIFSAGGELAYQSLGGGGNRTAISIYPAVSYRWFGLGSSVALRGDAGLEIVQTNSAGSSSSDSGLKIQVGLFNYF